MTFETVERYQLIKTHHEGKRLYAVFDAELDIILAIGTLEEMSEYRKLKASYDELALWQ